MAGPRHAMTLRSKGQCQRVMKCSASMICISIDCLGFLVGHCDHYVNVVVMSVVCLGIA